MTGRPVAAADSRTEALLHKAWRRLVDGNGLVRARAGGHFRVIYAGRSSDGPGPDFRDAVLQSADGRLLRGDVEIHVRASGWYEHGHQHDRRYNGVIFHVASEGEADAINAAGMRIPLLILDRLAVASLPSADLRQAASVPDSDECMSASMSPEPSSVAAMLPRVSLGEAGDRRFLAKSSGFQVALKTRNRDDVMWSAVLEGLGYARNRKGFRGLGSRVSWGTLASSCEGLRLSTSEIQLLLLWAAGLAGRPLHASAAGRAAERLAPLPGARPQWIRAVGRPANHPSRRIAGAAYLAHRWLSEGGPAASLEGAVLAASGPRELVAALVVNGESRDSSYLGRGRAATIVVNSVLPCLHAIAFDAGRWHLAERCVALYRAHPKLPENGIERETRTLLNTVGRTSVVAGARDQQGLLYVYRALTMQ